MNLKSARIRWAAVRTLLPVALLIPQLAHSADDSGIEFFEREIRPILADSCYKCHSVDAKKLKGGLYLDSRPGVLEGGDLGPAVVPGDIEKSLLIESVRYENVDLQMPPKSRLSDKQIAALEKWVSLGAPWPAGEENSEGRREVFDLEARKADHWCWQPPREHPVPEVADKNWPLDPIDNHILARLEKADLHPAPDADRRTWIRRVSFDLTGLPPSQDTVDQFVSDGSEDAHETAVAKLLESPDFGVKWARHWLDLMRYAETYGHEFDYPIPDSWRYRDHVIRNFNADVPYDQMLIEHLAGDLLEAPRIDPASGMNESLLATASWWLGEANHAPTDVRNDEMMRIDNQIDVVSKAFLGLTVSCARCHDHKFDAISTADFYSLAGYLVSSRRQLAMHDPGGEIASRATRLRELQSEACAALEAKHFPAEEIRTHADGLIASFEDGLPAGWTTTGEAFPNQVSPAGHSQIALIDEAAVRAPGGIVHSGLYGRKLQGALRSPTFTLEQPEIHLRLAATGPVEARVVVDGYFMQEFNPLLFTGTRLDAPMLDTAGEFVWKSIAGDLRKYVGHSVYLEFLDRGDGYLAIDEISYQKGSDAPAPAEQISAAALGIEAIFQQAKEIESHIPAPIYALAMTDGTPRDENVHIRGSHQSPGELVPRQFLTALGGGATTGTATGSGRLALAHEIASPDNPLTARVYVNRLWHHLMGKGLVASVDDFGVMGEKPSHPELLDQLALDLVEGGWSTKAMVKRIVLSRTYRMSSDSNLQDPQADDVDAANILLHKFRVRRLTSESIHDATLAVSGELDRTQGGPSVPPFLSSFMEGRGRPASGPLDGNRRRSIYTQILRNFLPPFQTTFDMPVPFTTIGRRSNSNVPAQSLVLMNDPFVIGQAQKWAQQLLQENDSDKRIRQAYLTALSREPSDDERLAISSFLEGQRALLDCAPDDPALWTEFCHLLLNQKEFIFLR